MAMFQNPVGAQIYAWTRQEGAPSPGTTECVISAHGGQTILNKTFSPNGPTLVFYCPHGYSLIDPGLDEMLEGKIVAAEEVSEGDCQDYVLSKFQGSHSDGVETYRRIGNADVRLDTRINEVEARVTGLQERIADPNTKPRIAESFAIVLESKLDELNKLKRRLDIITLRNRRLTTELTLSQVIAALKKAGYGYTRFHCCFCRSPQLRSGPGDFTAPTNPPYLP